MSSAGFFVSVGAQLGKPVRIRTANLWTVSVLTLVALVAIPFNVPVDGILYLSSAKSLFKSAFATDYAWFREPGYPLVLRVLHLLGNDGLWITAFQAVCMGLALCIVLYIVLRALGRSEATVWQLILVILLALNPMFLMYSALVLQQAVFTLQLALFGLGIALAFQRPAWLRRWMLVALALLNYFCAIWTSIGWIYLALVPLVLTIVLTFSSTILSRVRGIASRGRRLGASALAVLAIAALTVLVYGAGIQVYSGWQAVKAPHLHNLTIPGAVIEPLSSVPRSPTLIEMTNAMFALMHVGTVHPYVSENNLFLHQETIPSRAVGLYDTKYKSEPYTTYASGWISVPNASEQIHFVYSKTAVVASSEYVAMFIAFLVLCLLSLVRRRGKLLALLCVPLSFLAVYAASGSPIDRYGIPAFPWAVVSFVILVTWAGELIGRIRRRNPARR